MWKTISPNFWRSLGIRSRFASGVLEAVNPHGGPVSDRGAYKHTYRLHGAIPAHPKKSMLALHSAGVATSATSGSLPITLSIASSSIRKASVGPMEST